VRVELLNTTHHEHCGARLARLRALYRGGDDWRALLDTWLPQRAVEPDSIYVERRSLATYVNHSGSIVSVLSAALFAEQPQVDGVDGDYWEGLVEDCDGRGSSWRAYWKERLNDAQVGRVAYVWVNLPARAEGSQTASLADEQRAGLLDAYLVAILPEQVLDWWSDERGRLTAVMMRDVLTRRAGPEAGRQTIWRWTYIDAAVIRRWEWAATKDRLTPRPEDDARELAPIAHGLGTLPVVAMELPHGLWTMGKLEDPAVAALRARSEHTWALHQAANELLTVTSKWGDERIELGHGHYLRLSRDADGADEAAYVGPSGAAFGFLEKDVQATREEVYRTVQQMALSADSDASSSRLSGESKAEDWRALDIILAAYRDVVLGAMLATARIIARVRREDDSEISVSGLDGWQNESLAAFVETAALAVDARQLSGTFRRLVAKREAQRLLQDEVSPEELQAVLDEIEQADTDEAAAIYGSRRQAAGGDSADEKADEERGPKGDAASMQGAKPPPDAAAE